MNGFKVLLRKEMREYLRTSRLLVVATVFLLVGFGSPLLAKYTPDLLEQAGSDIQIIVPTPTAKDAIDQLVGNVGQTGTFAAILLAMGAVARERERGTAALVLTKPVSRSGFLAAKFGALAATLSVGVILAGVAAYIYTSAIFETLAAGGYIAGCLILLLSILVYAAITFLGSTVTGATLPAAGIGIAAYIGISIVSIVPGASRFTPNGLYEPAQAFALSQQADWVVPLLANLGLLVAILVLTMVIFKRQEIGSS